MWPMGLLFHIKSLFDPYCVFYSLLCIQTVQESERQRESEGREEEDEATKKREGATEKTAEEEVMIPGECVELAAKLL